MKTTKYLLILLMSSFSLLFAQFEDELPGDEEDQAEEICIPENLLTAWDSLANKELEQDVRMLYSFGVEYYKNKSYKESMPYLWKVYLFAQDDRYKKNAIRKITNMYFTLGLVDSTLIACYRGLDKFPDEKTLHHYAGLLQNKLGKFRCGIPHYEALAASDPSNKDYAKTLAISYFKNEDEIAIEAQEKVVTLDPENADEKNILAIYVSHFHGEGADLEYRKKAYDQDPTNLDFAFSYAEAEVSAGNYKNALAPLALVIEKKPSAKVLLLRAEVYENLNKNNNAIADYKEVLKLQLGNVGVMLRIAENYRNNKAFSSARTWVYKTLKQKPGYGQAYISMGEIYEEAAAHCMDKRDGKIKYEDKLVYLKAAKEYLKAQKDPAFKSKAKTKYKNVLPFTPTQEDNFMHKNDKIKHPCYTSWIK